MKKVKVAVIGLGRIGKIHATNLRFHVPGAELVAVADPDSAGMSFAEDLGIKDCYTDYRQILERDDIDAVAICSPTETHSPYTIAFAEKGKHVFCEKPLDLSLQTIQQVDQVIQETGIKFMLAFNRRFDKDFARVRQSVVAGEIGDPHILKITSRDPGPPPISYIKISGGLFMDMVIHDFDMARFIVGDEVEEVFSQGLVRVDPAIGAAGDIDTALTSLKFKNGVLATIDTSRKATYGYDQRIEVFGSKGMAKIENHPIHSHQLFNKEGQQSAVLENFFLERYEQAYRTEMQAFIQAILEDKPMPVGARDGLMSTAIAQAANLSVKENRMVKLEEILS